MFRIYQ